MRNNIKQLLIDRNMTQEQLGDLTGLSLPTISMICRNARSGINLEHLGKIAYALGVSEIDKLLVLEVE